jgi:uncharacterized protein YndB with AHSA1/START domain
VIDTAKFKPKTVYVTYIASTPEKVCQALTDPAFTKRYFFGFAIDVEPKTGGVFKLLYPDGRVHAIGEVLDWSPPRRFSSTWLIKGMGEFDALPQCIVTYDVETSGEAVRVTMTESHSWDVPDAILAGGRSGWPAVLSNLKSVLETGKSLTLDETGPPPGMVEAVNKAVAGKPWLK